MLKVENIYKTFNPNTVNEKHALNGVSLTLNDGDFVTVAFSYPHGTKTIKADHPSIRKKTANEYN